MSMTDDILRNKFLRRVPAQDKQKYLEALAQWDAQNPAMAGTYDERVSSGLLSFVQTGQVQSTNSGAHPNVTNMTYMGKDNRVKDDTKQPDVRPPSSEGANKDKK